MAAAIAANAAPLNERDAALADIGAAIARGEQDKLAAAFTAGFDAGLTLDQAKEVVGQLYAYCGFPRALNAATTLRAVAGSKFEGSNVPGSGTPEPANLGTCDLSNYVLGSDSLSIGTTNQTELCGGPVKGPLFDFHPQLDAYLKAHLFGDIFARDVLDWRTRELVTVAALAARPETEPQMKAHVGIANRNGVTPEQTDAIVARVRRPADPAALPKDWSPIPVGAFNAAYAQYFTGRSYLHPLTTSQVPAFGVTFEPGCRNNWHVHHAETGGGQILVCTAGRGFYQEWGKPAVEMTPGVTVNIPAGVKHWHGAAPDSWFQHIALEVPGTGGRNEWLEPVDDAAYAAAMRPPAIVYFTHDISPAGLEKAYRALGRPLEGRKVAVKISTGEAGNTHYLKPELIGPLVRSLKGDIVECNTAYGGSRQETPKHRQTIEDHGFNAIAKVVIMDEFDQLEIPCPAGSTHLRQDLIGAAFTNYDGFVVLNHFKGHMMGGFGGALKNLSIGVASTAGKARIHSAGKTDDAGAVWGDLPPQKDFIESMAEAAGAVVNYMGDRAVYVSVMNNLSIDCDCDAHPHPPEMADVGILASLDPVALDKACVDLVYASDPKTSASLRERMETRLGPHILDHAEALGYGAKAYRLVSLDGTEPPSTKRVD